MIEQISDALLEEAVDAVAYHKSKAEAARVLGMARETLRNRLIIAEKRGITRVVTPGPALTAGVSNNVTTASLGRKHLVIPDGQVKEGVPLEHWECIGNYIVEKKPDVIINIGDFTDMPSLCMYDKGKRGYEGRRYANDIAAGRFAMAKLLKPLEDYNRTASVQYHPRMVLTLGNHEERIVRATELDSILHGTISLKDLGYEEFGWEVHDFLEVVVIDGVHYSHYFTSGVMGRPVSSARALVTKKHVSCTMGHVQKTDIDMSQLRADGRQIIGLFAGCCYLHDEDYLGPQGNSDRRQIVMCHEVEDGQYDPMFVSLKYLLRRYS